MSSSLCNMAKIVAFVKIFHFLSQQQTYGIVMAEMIYLGSDMLIFRKLWDLFLWILLKSGLSAPGSIKFKG